MLQFPTPSLTSTPELAPVSFDAIGFATFAALAAVPFAAASLTRENWKYRRAALILSYIGAVILIEIGIFISLKPKEAATSAFFKINMVLIIVSTLSALGFYMYIKRRNNKDSLAKPIDASLRFGLEHIDQVVMPYYLGKTSTVSDKKDAMSTVLRMISLTTVPSTIDTLARIGLFEVRDNGRFQVLAAHHIDAHRLPKLERTFSHDPSKLNGVVGHAVAKKKTILIPNVYHPPVEYQGMFNELEENKLPGQKAGSILCIPIFDDAPATEQSKVIAVISVSSASESYFNKRHVDELNLYALRIRSLLFFFKERVLFDPEITYGYRAITISGEVGSGKTSLMNEIYGILKPAGWRMVSIGARFREFCTQRGIAIEDVSQIPDEIHQQFDEYQREMLAEEELIIVEGRLSGWQARDKKDVLRIYCDLPLYDRAKRLSERENISSEEAKKKIDLRDTQDLERYQRLYGIKDYRTSSFYSLYLSTYKSPFELAKDVITAFKKNPSG